MEKLQPNVPFDMAFIDADKETYTKYFVESKRLLRSGGIIILDNCVRLGKIADPSFNDESAEGIRDVLKFLKDDDEVEATTIATVGERGHDGFIYAIKK